MQSNGQARLDHVRAFYDMLAILEERVGGRRELRQVYSARDWPRRGVYFLFESGETRTDSGNGSRLVRVGTHGLKTDSRSTLWGRLRQHRGNLGGRRPGSGNHRGSIFRLHVGSALILRDGWDAPSLHQWLDAERPFGATRDDEDVLERRVSECIGSMPFLWFEVDDDPGPNSLRGYIERNSIALLSNSLHRSDPIDSASEGWLGRSAYSGEVRASGLWNVNHVRDLYDPAFLAEFERLMMAQ